MAGRHFEELEVGRKFAHQPGRTVAQADNLLFTALTGNRAAPRRRVRQGHHPRSDPRQQRLHPRSGGRAFGRRHDPRHDAWQPRRRQDDVPEPGVDRRHDPRAFPVLIDHPASCPCTLCGHPRTPLWYFSTMQPRTSTSRPPGPSAEHETAELRAQIRKLQSSEI